MPWELVVTVGFDNLIAPAISRLVPDPHTGRALDLGCGSGRSSRLLRDLGFNVTGIDKNPKLIEAARSLEHNQRRPIVYRVDDFTASTMRREFDVVLLSFVILTLPSVQNLTRAVTVAFNALEQGGAIIVADVHPHNRCRENDLESAIFDEGVSYFDDGGKYQSKAAVATGGTKTFSPNFHYSLQTLIGSILTAGFALTALSEPQGGSEYPTHLIIRGARR